MQFIIISGLSGAGKSKAASDLEDLGFYCVDNMPAEMIPQFASLCLATKGRFEKVALVTDVRSSMTFDSLFQSLDRLDEMHLEYSIFFIEASTEVIIKRFKETRRLHPLMRDGTPVLQAVERERQLLEPVRTRASAIIDTTNLSTGKLRGKLIDLVAGGVRERAMHVTVLSFGFKYGLPLDADLVFDVRFLQNPCAENTDRARRAGPQFYFPVSADEGFSGKDRGSADISAAELRRRRKDRSGHCRRLHGRAAPLGVHRQRAV